MIRSAGTNIGLLDHAPLGAAAYYPAGKIHRASGQAGELGVFTEQRIDLIVEVGALALGMFLGAMAARK